MLDNRSLVGWFGDRKCQGFLKHVSAAHLFVFFFFFFYFFLSCFRSCFVLVFSARRDWSKPTMETTILSVHSTAPPSLPWLEGSKPTTDDDSLGPQRGSSVLSCFLRRKKGLKSITIDASLVPHRDSSVLSPHRDSFDSSVLSPHEDSSQWLLWLLRLVSSPRLLLLLRLVS